MSDEESLEASQALFSSLAVIDGTCGAISPDVLDQYDRLVDLCAVPHTKRPQTLAVLVQQLVSLAGWRTDTPTACRLFETLMMLACVHPNVEAMISQAIQQHCFTSERVVLLFGCATDAHYKTCFAAHTETIIALRRALVIAAVKHVTPCGLADVVSMVTSLSDPEIPMEVCDEAADEHRLAVLRGQTADAINTGIDVQTGLCRGDFDVTVSTAGGDIVVSLGDPADDPRNDLEPETVESFKEMFRSDTLPLQEPDGGEDPQGAYLYDFIVLFKEVIPDAVRKYFGNPDEPGEDPVRRCNVIMHNYRYVL